MAETRELTDKETRTLGVIRTWEVLVKRRAAFGALLFTPESFEVYKKSGLGIPVRTEWDKARGLHKVTLTIKDYWRYAQFAADQVGFVLFLDGSIFTKDGFIIQGDPQKEDGDYGQNTV